MFYWQCLLTEASRMYICTGHRPASSRRAACPCYSCTGTLGGVAALCCWRCLPRGVCEWPHHLPWQQRAGQQRGGPVGLILLPGVEQQQAVLTTVNAHTPWSLGSSCTVSCPCHCLLHSRCAHAQCWSVKSCSSTLDMTCEVCRQLLLVASHR
jgi:hypothetical protein